MAARAAEADVAGAAGTVADVAYQPHEHPFTGDAAHPDDNDTPARSRPASKSFAVAALAFAAATVCTCFFGLPLALVGVFLAAVAVVKARKEGRNAPVLPAVAAVVTVLVTLVSGCIWVSTFFAGTATMASRAQLANANHYFAANHTYRGWTPDRGFRAVMSENGAAICVDTHTRLASGYAQAADGHLVDSDGRPTSDSGYAASTGTCDDRTVPGTAAPSNTPGAR